ncbi:hypothetical protein AGMMS49587_15710 [Spirochaetia bacterium]|nr:hypothetical protein AGMMS49587_15710 [Spirochaetia bacterium]
MAKKFVRFMTIALVMFGVISLQGCASLFSGNSLSGNSSFVSPFVSPREFQEAELPWDFGNLDSVDTVKWSQYIWSQKVYDCDIKGIVYLKNGVDGHGFESDAIHAELLGQALAKGADDIINVRLDFDGKSKDKVITGASAVAVKFKELSGRYKEAYSLIALRNTLTNKKELTPEELVQVNEIDAKLDVLKKAELGVGRLEAGMLTQVIPVKWGVPITILKKDYTTVKTVLIKGREIVTMSTDLMIEAEKAGGDDIIHVFIDRYNNIPVGASAVAIKYTNN